MKRPLQIAAVLGLAAFFAWACLYMTDALLNLDIDNSCKAFCAQYFFSLLPLPGLEPMTPPLLVDSEIRCLPLKFMPHVGTAFFFLYTPPALLFRLLRVPFGPET